MQHLYQPADSACPTLEAIAELGDLIMTSAKSPTLRCIAASAIGHAVQQHQDLTAPLLAAEDGGPTVDEGFVHVFRARAQSQVDQAADVLATHRVSTPWDVTAAALRAVVPERSAAENGSRPVTRLDRWLRPVEAAHAPAAGLLVHSAPPARSIPAHAQPPGHAAALQSGVQPNMQRNGRTALGASMAVDLTGADSEYGDATAPSTAQPGAQIRTAAVATGAGACADDSGVGPRATAGAPVTSNAFAALMSGARAHSSPSRPSVRAASDQARKVSAQAGASSSQAAVQSVFDWSSGARNSWVNLFVRWVRTPERVTEEEPGLYVRSEALPA